MAVGFKRHLLYAGLFVLVAAALIGYRNWSTLSVMLENATALNEGGTEAAEIRSPEDLLAYLSRHPQYVSLAAVDVGAEEDGIFVRADTPRAVTSLPKLLVQAEYHRRVAAGTLEPERRVPLSAVDRLALPGVTAESHRRTVDTLRARGWIDPDSTVSLRHWATAALQWGDDAAADWMLQAWGPSAVAAIPERFGLDASTPPQPVAGTYLAWIHRSTDGDAPAQTGRDRLTARAFDYTRLLADDAAFRRAERKRLQESGSGLTLSQQQELALSTYPTATAREYAALLGRVAAGSLSVDGASEWTERWRQALEHPVDTDTVQTVFSHIASKSGAYPGLLSFAGYARRTNGRPPRVVVLLVEDLPLAVLYQLLQTGIDKGFQLQLLGDDAFFERVRETLARDTLAESRRRAPTDDHSASESRGSL